jgi:hypothetical protein
MTSTAGFDIDNNRLLNRDLPPSIIKKERGDSGLRILE